MDILRAFQLVDKNYNINIKGTIENPLFQAKQIADILDIKSFHSSLRDFDDDEKIIESTFTNGGNQNTIFLTEIGLYKLVSRSKKPIAKTFQKWMINVLKDIRINGFYVLDNKKEVDKSLISHQSDLTSHKSFMTAFHAKNVVYLCKLRQIDDSNLIVKIGSTQNIKERMTNIAARYENVQPVLLHVVENNSHCKLETFFLNHSFISQFYYKIPMKSGKDATETFLVNDEQLKEFICIMEDNKFKFNDSALELEKTRLKSEELVNKTIEERIKLEDTKLEEKKLEIRRLELLQELKKLDLDKSNTNYISDEESISEDIYPIENVVEQDDYQIYIKKRNNGSRVPKVYQYSPDNLSTPIEIFDSPSDVERILTHLEISPAPLRAAFKNNTIYKGFRWLFVSRKETQPTTIPDTVISRHKSPDIKFLAMIDIKKTKILEVFRNQKEAVEARNLKSNGFTRAIQQYSISSGHYWKFFDDCPEEMKQEYLSRAILPEPFVRQFGKLVQQIHPKTNEIIATYNSNRDVIKKFQMSTTTLKKVSESGAIHHGFKWKIVDTSE